MIDPLSILQPAGNKVRDPIADKTLWQAGLIQNARIEDGRLVFDLMFTERYERGVRKSLEEALIANVRQEGFEGDIVPMARLKPTPKDPVAGMSGGGMQPHGGPIMKKRVEGVKRIIAVASGKGGVGKSTVACNLAVALSRQGWKVGLLDADVYGPSVPMMMNANGRPLIDKNQKIIPLPAHGVSCLSIGMLVDPDQPIIWRGPMVMGALRQFIQDTHWGDLDVLVIDLPPGTGDAQLSLIQSVNLAGAVIVTTPQDVALADAARGIAMFRKLDVPLLGLVENMAYYELPDGSKDFIFGKDGGIELAKRYETAVLGQIPLESQLRASGDEGQPVALDDTKGAIFLSIAAKVRAQLETADVS